LGDDKVSELGVMTLHRGGADGGEHLVNLALSSAALDFPGKSKVVCMSLTMISDCSMKSIGTKARVAVVDP